MRYATWTKGADIRRPLIQKAFSFIRSRQFFTFWFGLGIPPFLIGTVFVAFWSSFVFGVVTFAVTVVWLVDTVVTTCRRCPYYGSAKCGVPSLVTPLMFAKASPIDISIRRIKMHYYADLGMICYVNFVYWHLPTVFPIVFVCSFVGWLVVFRRKKFHGLLFRLDSAAHVRSPREAKGKRIELIQLTVNRGRQENASVGTGCGAVA